MKKGKDKAPQPQIPYGQYSIATLREWALRLRKFRFCHAFGGHANDPDSLQVRYRCESEADLAEFCDQLGLSLRHFDAQPAQPEIGKAYSADEIARFPSLIRNTRWIAQPGHCEIAGQKAFVWCESDCVQISVGRDYVVTEADVSSAQAIEPLLERFEAQRIDPPVDSWHCICPKYHPEYFAS